MPIYPPADGHFPQYTSPVSSLGNAATRPSSAAFSFGAGDRGSSARLHRGQTFKHAQQSQHPIAQDRPQTSDVHAREAAGNSSESRPQTTPPPKPLKYTWLHGHVHSTPMQMAIYQPTLDGADMPRANEFVKAPTFSFGRDGRFSERVYIPHKPMVRSSATPGPVYDIPETLGTTAPAYSFPRVSDQLAAKLSQEKHPGPGSYNIRLEHRMEALLSETAFGRLDSLEASPGVDASSESPQSGRIRSPATSTIGLAEGFGLKFGDVPTRSTAPAFSFGSGNRQTRAKCYYTGDLNKEMSGRSSPGPVTALQDMAKDAVSNWDAPPNFSFGGKNVGRNKLLQQSCMVGPAQYGGVDAVGEQASSMCATAPIIGFGSAERRHIDFQYVPNDIPPHIPYNTPKANETPGPVYFENSDLGIAAVGRQLSSTKKNAPKFRFGTSIRDKESKMYMPRSGIAKDAPAAQY
mmetsp:Transcript_31170/g.105719  ORF Transcript_31170/g.105719 Transcript_31170/m.105719 type:complete len:462 (-) Transcript_31170:146-1531(-)